MKKIFFALLLVETVVFANVPRRWDRHPPFKPYYQFPSQGYPPNYYYPQTRLQQNMQTEHHDFFMTQPQPQRNPPGPKVHQMPGTESTHPLP